MGRDRDREIEVLNLSRRIAAEVESGSVDEVEMSDEQLKEVAEVLCAGLGPVVRLVAPTAMAVGAVVHQVSTVLSPVGTIASALAS
ncbi:hypothetical protein Ait01nite_020540 [Actinoplanes italicus]|nr:hypothetical protein Ait01nite_020540 [Actinoplanes italicus]